MAEHYSSFQRSSWRWVAQRVTAVFLIGALAFHFVLLHFINHAAEISFAGTQARMDEIGYLSLMVTFLVTAAFHGLNGVYNALVNQGLEGTQKRVVGLVLVLAGVLLVGQGTYVALSMNGFI
ncbi:succinate dehydrogenase [Halovenus rubra]|uniref:Succinate dehydrogenase n=2 Tax=Halovenus rubra TaxID=869890 RepID=A0ABD5X7B8_9EURY|nr:succinate dehydrogenase [Halovenus rubra]